jgi:transposase
MKTMTSPSADLTQEMTSSEALLDRLSSLEKSLEALEQDYDTLAQDQEIYSEVVGALCEKNKILQEDLDRAYLVIRQLKQQHFGRKSEKLDIELPQLPGLQNLFDEAGLEPAEEPEEETPEQVADQETKEKKKPGRRPLPKDLPRERIIHDLPEAEKQCKCCGHQMVKFGEVTSEQLLLVPAQLKVLVHTRLKYACRACEEGVTLAPLPPQPIPKSIASASLLAHILVSKYADHLPLYRQSDMWKRLGIDISRSTMSGWVIKCGTLLAPLVDLMRFNIINHDYARADETTLQVLNESGRKATDKSFMWVFMTEGLAQKSIVYRYDPTRRGAVAEEFLKGFKGHLQSDAYSGYKHICKDGIISVGCWAHARRKFVDILKIVSKTGKATEAVAYIEKLYEIERYAKEKNLPPDKVKELRQAKSKVILDSYKAWAESTVPRVPPKNPLCAAIKYSLNNWAELTRYLDDGRLDIDNNACERAMKPFAVGRKNWLFAGNELGAKASAVIFSLIETCEANGIEPEAYLKHVLENIHTTKDLSQLLPFNFKPALNKASVSIAG